VRRSRLYRGFHLDEVFFKVGLRLDPHGRVMAGILWQPGGVFALFGVRIAIAIVAEISAIIVFGELQDYRPGSES